MIIVLPYVKPLRRREGKPGNKIEPNNIHHHPVTRQPEIDIKQPESRPEFTYVKQLEPEFKTVKQPELKNRSLHSTRRWMVFNVSCMKQEKNNNQMFLNSCKVLKELIQPLALSRHVKWMKMHCNYQQNVEIVLPVPLAHINFHLNIIFNEDTNFTSSGLRGGPRTK